MSFSVKSAFQFPLSAVTVFFISLNQNETIQSAPGSWREDRPRKIDLETSLGHIKICFGDQGCHEDRQSSGDSYGLAILDPWLLM